MWLLKPEVAAEIRRARKNCAATGEQRAQFSARCEAVDAATQPRSLQIAGDTAEIRIEGVLTPRMDFFLWLFGIGNTTYSDIQAALAVAAQDPAIRRVVLKIDSPGGMVAGLFETLAVLETFPKPISVRAALAASAAYALAAQGGKIEATNAAAEFGSIGVAVTYFLDEELVDITSTEAPNKRPDPATEEGRAVIREHLDAIHDLFVDAIARGRSRALGETLTKDTVNETFGRGSVLLAAESKKRKMIDKAPPAAPRGARAEDDGGQPTAKVGDLVAENAKIAAAASVAQPPRKKTMTKEELKAQFPETYEAIYGEGIAAGEAKERKRVNAHLKLADATGAIKVARAAIASGASTMDEEVHAEYVAAGMNRRDSDNRQADSDGAGAAADGAAPAAATAEGQDMGDQVAAVMLARRGKKPESTAAGAR